MGCAQRPAPPAVLCSLARSPLPLPLQPLSGYYHHATFPTFEVRQYSEECSKRRPGRDADGETRSEPEPHAIEHLRREQISSQAFEQRREICVRGLVRAPVISRHLQVLYVHARVAQGGVVPHAIVAQHVGIATHDQRPRVRARVAAVQAGRQRRAAPIVAGLRGGAVGPPEELHPALVQAATFPVPLVEEAIAGSVEGVEHHRVEDHGILHWQLTPRESVDHVEGRCGARVARREPILHAGDEQLRPQRRENLQLRVAVAPAWEHHASSVNPEHGREQGGTQRGGRSRLLPAVHVDADAVVAVL
eukprot:scaffold115916_cov75-Phaeocystis_antarctica.AAC.4